jgi:IclR family acetate operon transcriptional repressor
LADLDERQLRATFGAAPLPAHTKQSIVSLPQLARVCAQIRSQGYATDDGEYLEGIRCVAAPIRSAEGRIVGSIGISATSLRFSKDRYPTCAEQVLVAARQISASLTGQPVEQ